MCRCITEYFYHIAKMLADNVNAWAPPSSVGGRPAGAWAFFRPRPFSGIAYWCLNHNCLLCYKCKSNSVCSSFTFSRLNQWSDLDEIWQDVSLHFDEGYRLLFILEKHIAFKGRDNLKFTRMHLLPTASCLKIVKVYFHVGIEIISNLFHRNV